MLDVAEEIMYTAQSLSEVYKHTNPTKYVRMLCAVCVNYNTACRRRVVAGW